MRIAYIKGERPLKANKKDNLKQAAILMANRLNNSRSATRNAEKIFETVLNEKANYTKL
jgi:hypothetical protein